MRITVFRGTTCCLFVLELCGLDPSYIQLSFKWPQCGQVATEVSADRCSLKILQCRALLCTALCNAHHEHCTGTQQQLGGNKRAQDNARKSTKDPLACSSFNCEFGGREIVGAPINLSSMIKRSESKKRWNSKPSLISRLSNPQL